MSRHSSPKRNPSPRGDRPLPGSSESDPQRPGGEEEKPVKVGRGALMRKMKLMAAMASEPSEPEKKPTTTPSSPTTTVPSSAPMPPSPTPTTTPFSPTTTVSSSAQTPPLATPATHAPKTLARGRATMLREKVMERAKEREKSPGVRKEPSDPQPSPEALFKKLTLEAEPEVKPGILKTSSSKSSPTSSSSGDVNLRPKLFKGSLGKPISSSANYFSVKLDPKKGVFEYEVKFEPRLDAKEERFKIINRLHEILGPAKVFTGHSIFLPNPLESDEVTVSCESPNTSQKIEVTFNFKGQRPQTDKKVVAIYNNLFGKIFRILDLVQHKRSYFNPKLVHQIKQYKLDIWPGFVTSVDFFEGGLLVQIDVTHRVLRDENLRDVILAILKKGGPAARNEVVKQLVGETVITKYNNRSYRIDDLDFNKTPLSTFINTNGEEISFFDYYKAHYGIVVKDKEQPLMISKVKIRSPGEKDVERMACLIPELCFPTGLTEQMRADFKIMKEVGNYTRVTPENRQESMMKFMKIVNQNEEASTLLKNWGLTISDTTIDLSARTLTPETIYFKNHKEQVNAKGDWGRSATSKGMLTPVTLQKWAVVFVDKNKAPVQKFCQIMQKQASNMGMSIADPKVVSLPNDKTETYLKELRKLIDPSVQLIMTIFPGLRSDRYSAVKKLCYVEKPIASQCINLKTIASEKKVTSVAQKVALQINCKLGGELWACGKTPFKGVMVVGIDVFHDTAKKSRSIAGVVASMNESFSRYFSTVAFQQPGQEIVDALTVSVLDCLIKYWEINRILPAHIVVFRDGVGDGQLDVTKEHEVAQFVRSFSHIAEKTKGREYPKEFIQNFRHAVPSDYCPGFYFMVVQKRINTRLFLKKRMGSQVKFENPPAGTVMDHTVTRFSYKDFFLVPQTVNQGTVTPTHLIMLMERHANNPESAMTADDLQKLSYKLTHMYFNWPGTVRVPSPCQYANKLVAMVGDNLHTTPAPQLLDKLFYL